MHDKSMRIISILFSLMVVHIQPMYQCKTINVEVEIKSITNMVKNEV